MHDVDVMLFVFTTCTGETGNYLFIGFIVAPTPLGSYGDFQFLHVEEDPMRTNIEILACMDRTADAPQVSRKNSPHGSFCPDRVSNQRDEGLSD